MQFRTIMVIDAFVHKRVSSCGLLREVQYKESIDVYASIVPDSGSHNVIVSQI